MKKISKSTIILFVLLFILICSLFVTKIITDLVLNYNDLFIKKLFPTSFFFFIVTNLLIEYNFVYFLQSFFHIKSVYFYVFILSLCSGFPNGAIIIKDLLDRNIIDENIANKMILYAHFPNPLFVINCVSSILNTKYAIYILLAIIVSNILIYFFIPKERVFLVNDYKKTDNFSNVLSRVIFKSVRTLILIYGISVIFYILSYFISNLFIDNTYIYVLVNGLFDLTKGLFSTSLIKIIPIRCIFIIFFICFGSISIHLQIKSILEDTCVSYKKFVLGRIFSTCLAIIIFMLFRRFH